MYPWHWSGIEVAGFDVLKPLYADGVDEKEGVLTHTMTLTGVGTMGAPGLVPPYVF